MMIVTFLGELWVILESNLSQALYSGSRAVLDKKMSGDSCLVMVNKDYINQ